MHPRLSNIRTLSCTRSTVSPVRPAMSSSRYCAFPPHEGGREIRRHGVHIRGDDTIPRLPPRRQFLRSHHQRLPAPAARPDRPAIRSDDSAMRPRAAAIAS
ncbi:hypothetical protein HEP84_56345 [Streptomyces sp. RLB1-33]